jgi:hypothetical protein
VDEHRVGRFLRQVDQAQAQLGGHGAAPFEGRDLAFGGEGVTQLGIPFGRPQPRRADILGRKPAVGHQLGCHRSLEHIRNQALDRCRHGC